MSSRSEVGRTAAPPPSPRPRPETALVELYEVDLKRHEEALIDLGRTETAIRGFAITAVAALVAAAYASGENWLGVVALLAATYFAFLDYYTSRLDAEIKERVEFLATLAQTYRQTLGGGKQRRQAARLKLQVHLRSFQPFGAMPTKPVLWMGWRNWRARKRFERRQKEARRPQAQGEPAFTPTQGPKLGPFKQFCFLYAILGGIAVFAAIQINHGSQERIILCQPAGSIAATGEGVELQGCETAPAPEKRPVAKNPEKASPQP